MPRVLPPPSISATTWSATNCSPRSAIDGADLPANRDGALGERSSLVTTLRSVVLGCGSYLPARILTNDELARRSTPATSGSCSAPASANAISRRPANSPPTWRCRPRARRSPMPMSRRARSISSCSRPRRRTRPFPATAVTVQAGSASPAARLSICRRCARASSTRWRSPTACSSAAPQARAGDRRGDLLAHPGLERPHHLRAVRRRRRRGRAGGAAQAGHQRRPRHPDHASALGRPPQGQALCRWRPVLDQTVGHLRMEGRECSGMRWR